MFLLQQRYRNATTYATVDADVTSENSSEVKLKKIEEMQNRMNEMEYD